MSAQNHQSSAFFIQKKEKKTKRILYPLSEPLFHIKLYIDYRLCAKSLRVAEVIEDIKTTNTQPTFHIQLNRYTYCYIRVNRSDQFRKKSPPIIYLFNIREGGCLQTNLAKYPNTIRVKKKQQPHNKSYFVTACRPVSVLSKGEVSHPFFQTYTFANGLKLGSQTRKIK